MKNKHGFRGRIWIAVTLGGATWAMVGPARADSPALPPEGASPDTSAASVATAAAPPRKETARVDLGVSVSSLSGLGAGAVGGLGAGAVGGLGGIGGSILPSVEATFELHLTGPLWALARLSGGYSGVGVSDGYQANTWSVSGDAGVRLEPQLFHWLDAGGHLTVGAQWAESDSNGLHVSTGTLRGLAGVGAHFRATDFFGVRLSLDVLSATHSYAVGPDYGVASTSLSFTAAPRVELTFTF